MNLLGFATLTPTYTLQPTHYFWPWIKHAEIIAGMWGISHP